MQLTLQDIGKRYRREWILKHIDLTVRSGAMIGVTGPNGSGKSTLLRMLAGYLTPSRGRIQHEVAGRMLPIEEVYREVTYAAPYIELIEELTLSEAVRFHERFKPFYPDLHPDEVVALLDLEAARDKPLRNFSSGMLQRVKVGLACCSRSSLLLLDEPTTNLDAAGAAWYQALLHRYRPGRTVVIASNVTSDFPEEATKVDVRDWK